MSLAGCQARAGLPERLDMLWQCMLSKLARVTALVRPRKLPAGPPWTPSPPLPLIAACSRFSTQAAVFASRTAPCWWQHASVYCASTNAALTRALPFELRSSALFPVG